MTGAVIIKTQKMAGNRFRWGGIPDQTMLNWLKENIGPCGMTFTYTIPDTMVGEDISLSDIALVLAGALDEQGEQIPMCIQNRTCKVIVAQFGVNERQWQHFECFYDIDDIEHCQTIIFMKDEMKALEMKLSIS
jgi:hypothetical protein